MLLWIVWAQIRRITVSMAFIPIFRATFGGLEVRGSKSVLRKSDRNTLILNFGF